MPIVTHYGRDSVTLEVAEANLLRVPAAPASLNDVAQAVRSALESPLGFPPLRRALTPDDRVTIVIDDRLPSFLDLLVPILEHLTTAGVKADAITLLSAVSSPHTAWIDDLPDAYQDAVIETHDATERKRLAYLATTRRGRRLYLNRSLVDADQVVVLTGRGHHPWYGPTGGESGVFPALSDAETLEELSPEPDAASRERLAEEALETAWLLGVPFFVQIIEAAGDGVADIVAGPIDSSTEARRRFDQLWRQPYARQADVVIATLSGDPKRHDCDSLCRALFTAAQVVRPGGKIALLSQAQPNLDPMSLLLQSDEAGAALSAVRKHQPLNTAARWWLEAVDQARLYLLSGLADEVAEHLFATPLQRADQAQRLIGIDDVCVIVQDAHKVFAEMET
jgi:nickel-dependent lactate racemase